MIAQYAKDLERIATMFPERAHEYGELKRIASALRSFTNSTAQGLAGHSGATESTGSALSDAAVRPTNSYI